LALGFSLVELLIVIGIVAVLLAILVPAMGRARAQAKLVKCQANLKTQAAAHRMYWDDNKGRRAPIRSVANGVEWVTPNVRVWTQPVGQGYLVPKYLSFESLLCPSEDMADDVDRDREDWGRDANVVGSSYAYCAWTGDPTLARRKTHALCMDLNLDRGGDTYVIKYAGRRPVAHLRLGVTNIAFTDGSVRAAPMDKVMLRYPHGTNQEIQWFLRADAQY
jgi:prepilin-type N-terminal cleavage/methylation domain-containing protein